MRLFFGGGSRGLFRVVFGLTAIVLAVLYLADAFPNGPRNWLRIFAATVAMTGTLGRGGVGIWTFPQKTVVERIDRGESFLGPFRSEVTAPQKPPPEETGARRLRRSGISPTYQSKNHPSMLA